MTTFIQTITSALLPSSTRIACNSFTWHEIVCQLHRRGREKTEAGCFLLGTVRGPIRLIRTAVYYDDLVPGCLDGGGIEMRRPFASALWDICKTSGTQVVADIHTHPGRAEQSSIDQKYPAIALPGHVAFILPRFARAIQGRVDVGVFEYHGNFRWTSMSESSDFFALRWWL